MSDRLNVRADLELLLRKVYELEERAASHRRRACHASKVETRSRQLAEQCEMDRHGVLLLIDKEMAA